ncbi:MAG: hypothetical protein HYT93_04555 [Parcubacteria group bacterium]|nr:hypothetical protein [Parcubacteria group bacterium]
MLQGIIEQNFPLFGDGPLNKALEEAHENDWEQPGTPPSTEKMDIITIVNLLEQDYCE